VSFTTGGGINFATNTFFNLQFSLLSKTPATSSTSNSIFAVNGTVTNTGFSWRLNAGVNDFVRFRHFFYYFLNRQKEGLSLAVTRVFCTATKISGIRNNDSYKEALEQLFTAKHIVECENMDYIFNGINQKNFD